MVMPGTDRNCELCRDAGGRTLWSDGQCRVVLVDDADYPGYCRVIWNGHKREMSDLADADRRHLMNVVFALETALRACLAPDKINLASLGNQTPHLHWHVIPRRKSDRHFPNSIWGEAKRGASPAPAVDEAQLRERFIQALTGEQSG